MKICIVCHKKSPSPLCIVCKQNPFRVENYRQLLTINHEFESLRATYNKEFAEIKNTNSSRQWDTTFNRRETLQDQDGMTQDRVRTVAHFIPAGTKKILDIGMGLGYVEEILAKNLEVQLYGNDFSTFAISRARKMFKGTFEVARLEDMQYPKSFFDTVLVLEVMEHISPRYILTFLRRIKEVLKPNGYLVVSVPMNEGLEMMKYNPNAHVRTYSHELILAELQLAGFAVLQTQTLYAFRSFYIGKKFLAKIFPNRWKPNNIVILARSI